MIAEQKAGLKPLQVYTLMKFSRGERCTEQKTSETAEAVGVERESVEAHFTQRKMHTH